MSDEYRKQRDRAKLRADGSIQSLLIWAAVAATGSGLLFIVLSSIK